MINSQLRKKRKPLKQPVSIGSMNINPVSAQLDEIKSELVFFPSRNGLKITAYVDSPPKQIEPIGYVVMAPKYGETKKNNLQIAYYLAANGLVVLRFDHTNHVGESEGEMLCYTLPGAVEDILGAYDYLERQRGVTQAGLVASSLAARMAIRAASLDSRVSHLTCLVGVVNIQRTLATVYQEDVVSNYLDGKRWGVNDVLGFEIDFENFAAAMIESSLYSLRGTCDDMALIQVPVSMLAAENDAWVDMEEVRHVINFSKKGYFYHIQDAMHEVRENPVAAQKTFRQLVSICVARATGGEVQENAVIAPDKKNLMQQNKTERERLRRINPERQKEIDFWSQYLSKYKYFQSVDVYENYINLVGELLGEFKSGELVLDAGCGNGMFGAWAIRHLLMRARVRFESPVIYSGIDLTHDGIWDAARNHDTLIKSISGWDNSAETGISFIYGRMDFDHIGGKRDVSDQPVIHFADNTFDKVCCSLLISYLKNPDELVRHLYRVLRPGGTLVLSSMKPFCDLSEMYRAYAEKNLDGKSEQEIEAGRNLLTAAGKIKFKEELGVYTFFSTEELSDMLANCGFKGLRTFSSFGNQANVVRAEK